jgi:hypothetical protein
MTQNFLYPSMNLCDIMKAWDHSGYMQKGKEYIKQPQLKRQTNTGSKTPDGEWKSRRVEESRKLGSAKPSEGRAIQF